jgi:putrescine transport system permease protein
MSASVSTKAARKRWLVILPPYAWIALFFLLPFAIVVAISLTEAQIGIPPFTPLVNPDSGALDLRWVNYRELAQEVHDAIVQLPAILSGASGWPDYIGAYVTSLKIAAATTLLCLLLGYPVAYAIARSAPATRNALLVGVMIPFWTSFLLRVSAWIGILRDNGLLNQLLMKLHLIDQPLAIMNTEWSVMIGMVYSYVPFMILPLYSHLVKLDGRLLEAAADLGARPWKAFLTITLPLSLPGVVAGSLLVFIPAVGEFVIPDLLGGSETLMIGRTLWNEFFLNRDWPVASAVAIVLLVILVVPIVIFQNLQARVRES